MQLILPIPIKPHLEKYIKVHLQQAAADKIKVDANSQLGGWLMGFAKPSKKPILIEPGVPFIELILPERDELGEGYDSRCRFVTVSQVNINRFNDFIDWLMKKELYDRLALIEERGENHQRNGKQRHEIDKFIRKYSTPGAELSYEALRKGYQRYKTEGKVLVDQLV